MTVGIDYTLPDPLNPGLPFAFDGWTASNFTPLRRLEVGLKTLYISTLSGENPITSTYFLVLSISSSTPIVTINVEEGGPFTLTSIAGDTALTQDPNLNVLLWR